MPHHFFSLNQISNILQMHLPFDFNVDSFVSVAATRWQVGKRLTTNTNIIRRILLAIELVS